MIYLSRWAELCERYEKIMATFELINKHEIPDDLKPGMYSAEFVESFYSVDQGREVFQFKFVPEPPQGNHFIPIMIH